MDSSTISLARQYKLDVEFYIENNDSYHFFEKLDSLSGERYHLKTGPTGTNVMDLQIIMVDKNGN